MGTWTEDIVSALENLGGIGTLSEIYESVKLLRHEKLPASTNAIIRGRLETNSSDSQAFKGKLDLFYSVDGIGSGIWGLRSFQLSTPSSIDLEATVGNLNPSRTETTTYRILRDTKLSKNIKLLYNDKCQICHKSIRINDKKSYSEAHHIIPLGGKHKGSDTADNILVLCPNHHVMMDYGLIKIDVDKLHLHEKHKINLINIDYHNSLIFKSYE